MIVGEFILVLVNIAMAWYHSDLMKDGIKIKHGWWALGYLALAGLFALLSHSFVLFICALLIRKVVFDISLNLFNKRHPFFVSTETTSIIDELHFKLFGKKSWIYYGVYTLAIIVINLC